jgi:hypothetical protein
MLVLAIVVKNTSDVLLASTSMSLPWKIVVTSTTLKNSSVEHTNVSSVYHYYYCADYVGSILY